MSALPHRLGRRLPLAVWRHWIVVVVRCGRCRACELRAEVEYLTCWQTSITLNNVKPKGESERESTP